MNKILGPNQIQDFKKSFGVSQKKTVLCHGVFDVIHAGHLAYFKSAKAYGDTLIVSITTDRHVNKGPGRPYFSTNVRAEMISALEVVDYVIISDSPTAIQTIEALKPDFYVKGPDYRDKTNDPTREIYNEEKAVESYGGKLVFTDDSMLSSSKIVNEYFKNWSDEQLATIESVKSTGGIEYIESVLAEISKLTVSVVGEPIIDVYRFVEPQGISSKSPSISTKFLYEEEYYGGALAIQAHVDSFVKQATRWPVSISKVPKKIRYLTTSGQRIFEVTDIDESVWPKERRAMKHADVNIYADFGHGLFNYDIIDRMKASTQFVALNVQTNSSNYGFNPYHKHKAFDYLSIDLREARIATQNKNIEALGFILESKLPNVSVTLGKAGALYRKDKVCTQSPAFASDIVDTIGAGDAYFAITSLLVKIGAKPEIIPFVGNVFAGLKTKIIGNKRAVTKAELLKALRSILK